MHYQDLNGQRLRARWIVSSTEEWDDLIEATELPPLAGFLNLEGRVVIYNAQPITVTEGGSPDDRLSGVGLFLRHQPTLLSNSCAMRIEFIEPMSRGEDGNWLIPPGGIQVYCNLDGTIPVTAEAPIAVINPTPPVPGWQQRAFHYDQPGEPENEEAPPMAPSAIVYFDIFGRLAGSMQAAEEGRKIWWRFEGLSRDG